MRRTTCQTSVVAIPLNSRRYIYICIRIYVFQQDKPRKAVIFVALVVSWTTKGRMIGVAA